MRRAAKIIALVLAGVFLLLAADGYLAVRRELALFSHDMQRDAEILGGALRVAFRETWHRSGEQPARELLRLAMRGEEDLRIRWVWLDAGERVTSRLSLGADHRRRLAAGQTVSVQAGKRRHEKLYTYLPARIGATRRGAIELSQSFVRRANYARETVLRKIWLLGGIALLSVLLMVPLGYRYVGRPLSRLAAKARRVGDGDLSGPVVVRGRDEFSELARAMNQMCERLAEAGAKLEQETASRIAAHDQLRHADRLVSIGRLAAGMAHELGTPLNVVMARAELIASAKLTEEQVAQSAGIIHEQAARMTSIISEVLGFARRRPTHREPVDLRQVVESTVRLLEGDAGRENVRLVVHSSPETEVAALADREQFQQVLMTLVDNAISAMPGGGDIEIVVERRRVAPPTDPAATAADVVCVEVRDSGGGIASEDLPHIFDPFFTTKEVGAGTGLGLSVAHGIVAEHGGWIDARSELGAGATFTVALPAEGSE